MEKWRGEDSKHWQVPSSLAIARSGTLATPGIGTRGRDPREDEVWLLLRQRMGCSERGSGIVLNPCLNGVWMVPLIATRLRCCEYYLSELA
jgi:hypothetical protein